MYRCELKLASTRMARYLCLRIHQIRGYSIWPPEGKGLPVWSLKGTHGIIADAVLYTRLPTRFGNRKLEDI